MVISSVQFDVGLFAHNIRQDPNNPMANTINIVQINFI